MTAHCRQERIWKLTACQSKSIDSWRSQYNRIQCLQGTTLCNQQPEPHVTPKHMDRGQGNWRNELLPLMLINLNSKIKLVFGKFLCLEWLGEISISTANFMKSQYRLKKKKGRDITLPTKVCIVKAMVFPVVMYGCESWTIKKAEHQRISNSGAREDSWESFGLQENQTSQS